MFSARYKNEKHFLFTCETVCKEKEGPFTSLLPFDETEYTHYRVRDDAFTILTKTSPLHFFSFLFFF